MKKKRRLALLEECDYEKEYEHILKRVTLWQILLEQSLYFENHASLTSRGAEQPFFYQRLLQESNAGLLYDISNAYIAENNKHCSTTKWLPLLPQVKHFHAAGFRYITEQIAIDSHDQPLAVGVLDYIKFLQAQGFLSSTATLVLEADANISYRTMVEEITHIKTILNLKKCQQH